MTTGYYSLVIDKKSIDLTSPESCIDYIDVSPLPSTVAVPPVLDYSFTWNTTLGQINYYPAGGYYAELVNYGPSGFFF